MSELKRLQESFQQFLLSEAQGVGEFVVGDDAEQRLAIYGNAYRLRLVEALDANYPKLHQVLGDRQFRQLGLGYLAEHPSHNPNIRWFGHKLAKFLATTAPYCQQPFLAELALFEWTLTEVFDAADAPALGPDAMAAISPQDWPDSCFLSHPSVRRIDLSWSVPQLWLDIENDKNPEPGAPICCDHAIGWVIWRRELRHYWRSMEVDESWAIDAMQRGQPLNEICEGLCEWIDPQHVAGHVAGMIRRWMEDGLVTSLLVET